MISLPKKQCIDKYCQEAVRPTATDTTTDRLVGISEKDCIYQLINTDEDIINILPHQFHVIASTSSIVSAAVISDLRLSCKFDI